MSNLEESAKEEALRDENSGESAEDTDFTESSSSRLAASSPVGKKPGDPCKTEDGQKGVINEHLSCVPEAQM
jgi:hypothetical protein